MPHWCRPVESWGAAGPPQTLLGVEEGRQGLRAWFSCGGWRCHGSSRLHVLSKWCHGVGPSPPSSRRLPNLLSPEGAVACPRSPDSPSQGLRPPGSPVSGEQCLPPSSKHASSALFLLGAEERLRVRTRSSSAQPRLPHCCRAAAGLLTSPPWIPSPSPPTHSPPALPPSLPPQQRGHICKDRTHIGTRVTKLLLLIS